METDPKKTADEHGEQNSPQVLVEVQDEFEAGAVITALKERGVEASSIGGFTAGFIAEAPGYVKIVVRKVDLEAAQAALEDVRLHHDEIDWAKVDVGRPEDPADAPTDKPDDAGASE